ncbi:MAG: UvrD-helicase domain-containing protein [Bdellovibrio sp.]
MSSTSSELKNIILRAGAGAGKTTTLTQTFLKFASDFKESHGKFPRIVVTTFTRKATQELKERLLAKALSEGREDLFHYVSSKSQVQISTIHGVLSLFLSRYGSSIGLTPDYKIMSEAEIRKNARKIMRRYILEDSNYQELLEEYDFQTLESALLKYFSENVIFPEMTFIDKEELQREAEGILNDISSKLKRVCTEIEHETSNDKWQEYAQSLRSFSWSVSNNDWNSFFEKLESFWEHLTKPVFRKTNAPFSLSTNEELEVLRDRIDRLLEEPRYRPQFWEKHQKNCEVFQELARKFKTDFMATKLDSGLLSMADLETLSFKIIRDAPEAAAKFSQEWDFWMVDEYQDTSPVQVELLSHLIGDKPQFVVGDPQQSIYLFRGARSEVFQEKVDEVKAKKGDVQVKLVNYRSSPEVLHFFNHYFTSLGSQFASMTPAPDKTPKGNADPVVQLILTASQEEDSASSEVLSTVARIQELLAEGVSPEQICVLSRTHKTLEDIAKVAQEHGVPLQLHSGGGFYERREVLDALCLLKFLVNPHDNKNFIALVRSPWVVIPDSELTTYCHSGKHSYWKEAQKFLTQKEEHHPLNILKRLLEQGEEKGLSYTFKNALVELGVFDYSSRIDSTGRREANLWKVVSLLYQEEKRPGFNYLDFLDATLETLFADEVAEDADATPVIEPKRVNFMTVHASKGLQFDQVIIPGMGQDPRSSQAPVLSIRESDGKWSLKIRNEDQSMTGSILAEQITEELRRRESEELNRVLYVAMTRAKSGVTLIWDQKPGKRSWASQCPLITEEGLHEEEHFSYLVRRDNLKPEKMAAENLVEKSLRSVWKESTVEKKRKYISVTDIINDETSGNGNQNPKNNQLASGLARAQQGTNAHRLFEALKYSSYEDLLQISDDDLKQPLQFIYTASEVPLSKIIEAGHVEWGFALNINELRLQGQIDLWGEVDNTIWIVDYKTGSQRYSTTAFKQLQVYAWALYRMNYFTAEKTVKLAVVYPMEEVIKTETVEDIETLHREFLNKLQPT